ncbi:MAG: helix-turn-helix transcriptional regulator [Clostridia bacterium]|nr:helix-turn-helix transcriptional regulator [Clostridia bacterium]
MKSQNICKFPISSSAESLKTHCFVYEADPENLEKKIRLSRHRLLLIASGSGTFFVNGTSLSVHMGAFLFLFEDEEFFLSDGHELTCLYVDFEGIRGSELLHRFGIHRDRRYFDGFGGIIPLWKDTLARATSDTLDLAAEGILLLSLSRLSVEEVGRSGIVSEMLEYTEQKYDDSELSISFLAEKLSYNAKYLSHLFKKEMGIGYSEYLRNIRINYARGLLDHGLDSIKNVALLSGFSDPLYFSEVFKKVVGLSPKEYISSQKEAKRG